MMMLYRQQIQRTASSLMVTSHHHIPAMSQADLVISKY